MDETDQVQGEEGEEHLGGQFALHILDLAPEHEGLQNLVQPVNDHHPLLHGHVVLPCSPWGSPAKAVPKPFGKLVLVIKYLGKANKEHRTRCDSYRYAAKHSAN